MSSSLVPPGMLGDCDALPRLRDSDPRRVTLRWWRHTAAGVSHMTPTGAPFPFSWQQTGRMGNETAPTLASARPHPLPPPWVGDLLAAVLVVVAAFVPFPDDEYRPRTLLAISVLIAPAGLLPLRRRWPLQVLAGTLALFGAAALIGTLSPGIVL